MKCVLIAAAAALVAGVSASNHRQHAAFHKRGAFAPSQNATELIVGAVNGTEECGCYTVWVTSYGEPTRMFPCH